MDDDVDDSDVGDSEDEDSNGIALFGMICLLLYMIIYTKGYR
jgi:hypothetical protein